MDISRKVAAGGVAGAVTIILVWLLAQFGISVPDYVAQAGTVIVSAVTGWLVRESGAKHVAPPES